MGCGPSGPPSLPASSIARAAPVLRLPEIRPPPSPTEQDLRLINQMQQAAEEARLCHRRESSSTARYSERTRSRPRQGSRGQQPRASLDDFLSDSAPRTGSAARRLQPRASRPTQRQPVDDETVVPAEVFEKMLQLGQEARSRATHTLAFTQPDGRPYLRHHAAALRGTLASSAAAAPLDMADPVFAVPEEVSPAAVPVAIPTMPARPSSSCASAAADERAALSGQALSGCVWEAHKALQVG